MYRNPEADARWAAGTAAAAAGKLELARETLDHTLRMLENDAEHDTGFLRAGVMIDLALVFTMLGQHEWAFQTLIRAEASSTDELSRHFQPGKGYVGISEADQAEVHLQICAAHIGMGIYYGMRAAAHETEQPGTGRGQREGESLRRWLAQSHFEQARAFDPEAAASFEQSLGRLALRSDFWSLPAIQPDWITSRDEDEAAQAVA